MYLKTLVFQGLNWDDLASRKTPAPFVPNISHELDVENFATEFTNMAATDSPAIVPMNTEKMFKVSTFTLCTCNSLQEEFIV